MDGEATSDIIYLIPTIPVVVNPTLDLPTSSHECCSSFRLNALADTGSPDQFKNDRNGFIKSFNEVIDTVEMKLFKNGVEVADLDDNTYGTFYDLGFYVDSKLNNYMGYQLNWKLVLTAFGAGCYQVKFNYTSAIGGDGTITSNEFNLQQYTTGRANGTVRLEYFLNGIIGDNSDDTQFREFENLNWYNSIRIPAFFGLPGATYEEEHVQYSNGQRDWVKNEQEPEFILKTKMLPAFVHDLMRTDVMQADTILITDYNSSNANTYIKKAVKPNSEYRPAWTQRSKLAEVEVKFIQEYNNLKRRRC